MAARNLQGRTPSEEERQHKVHEDVSLCLQPMSVHYWPLNIFLNISNIKMKVSFEYLVRLLNKVGVT